MMGASASTGRGLDIDRTLSTPSGREWQLHVIDLGPGAGDAGVTVVAAGTPAHVADKGVGVSARYLAAALEETTGVTPS